MKVISIPDDDEKSPEAEQESKKNGEEPMETDKPSNGESEGAKEKEAEKDKEKKGEGEKKSAEGGEEAKAEASEVKAEEPEVKGEEKKDEKMDTTPPADEKKGDNLFFTGTSKSTPFPPPPSLPDALLSLPLCSRAQGREGSRKT